MKHQFTIHHLISYLYNELSLLEKAAIELALREDEQLSNQLNLLKESQKQLTDIEFEPEQSCLDNILNYSKSNRLEKMH
jgi:hypothetical protein